MTRTIRTFEQFSLEMRELVDSSWSKGDLTGAEKRQLGTAGPDVGPYEFSPQTDSVAKAMDLSVGDLIEWDERVVQLVSLGDSDATSGSSLQVRVVTDTKDDDAILDTEPYWLAIWIIYKHWRKGDIRLDTDSESTQ